METDSARISAIVLAAGRSERLPPQKLLLTFDGKPVICRVIDELRTGRVAETVVVVGRDAHLIESALGDRRVQFVQNSALHSEMLTSVRCGIAAADNYCQAFLVVLGDQPQLSRHTVNKLIEAFELGRHGIVVPVYRSKRGHPVLISATYGEELMSQYDNVGLRGLLHAHPDDVREIAVSDSAVLDDLDTPEDYRRLLEKDRTNGDARD